MEEGCSWPRASTASSGCVASRSSMGGGTARVALADAGAWRDIGRLRQPPPTACAGAWAPDGGGAGPSDPTEKAGSWASFPSPAPPFPSGCRLFPVMETGDGRQGGRQRRKQSGRRKQRECGVDQWGGYWFPFCFGRNLHRLENGRG